MIPARARPWLPTAVLAAVSYVPLLLTHRGMVGADTKSYLYLDPARLLSRAWAMWDPNVGMGTVTHQNIGYLWPMGPWFWAFDAVGLPDWVAQRLWLGSILFLAGLGVRYLLRTLGQDGPHVTASMFVYALTPYVLTLGARLSAVLLPFVGLPWMIGLTVRALRDRSWVHPALFALLVTTIGATNATALVLAGVGPLLWVPFAVWVLREVSPADAARTVGRIGGLCVATSLWWIAGLYCQSAFGIDVLRYTETARTVAQASAAPEVLRGLGYWFFYGDDKLGPWIEPSVPYTQRVWLLAVTYLTPVLALLAAGLVRWRYRAYFASLVVVGTVLAVGAYPWEDPEVLGRGFKAFLLSETGLAMRSLPRAAPLVVLGLSVLLGSAIAAVRPRLPALVRPAALGVVALAVLGLPPLWTGDMVAGNLQRPEEIPGYWMEAAGFIDSQGRGQDGYATRVLELPGSDFASYRWGSTVDPITPGITDRPYVARELIPYGTPPAANLLNALDRQLQEQTLDPAAIAPVARLMGVGDIVLRSDLAYERYNLPRPRQTWALVTGAPGLGRPTGFGGTAPNVPDPALPLIDELELTSPPDLPDPPKVAVIPVENPEPIIRALPADRAVVVAGDGDGIVDAAGAGVLDGSELVFYSAAFADDRAALDARLGDDARIVVTDSNRKAARRWGTVVDTNGVTEAAGTDPLEFDPTDNRLPVFPDAEDAAFTVVDQRGGVTANATAYGNPITFTPESRAANAVDGDLNSAWVVGAFSPTAGHRLELAYDEPRTTDQVTLLQARGGIQNRFLTRVRLRFDGGDPLDVDLGPESRTEPGQVVGFDRRTFRELSIELLADDAGDRNRYDGLSAVGFADVRLGDDDARLREIVVLPRDVLAAAGDEAIDHPLDIVLTRRRSRPSAPTRSDEERSIVRAFTLATGRTFALAGQVRLEGTAPDAVIDELLGIPSADDGGVDASSSRRLSGDLETRAASAIDGDPTTAWSPGFLNQVGEFVRYRLDEPITFDHLDLQLVNDGRHSVPTRIRVDADGRPAATIDVPAVADQAQRDGTVTVPIDVPSVSGRDLTFTVEGVREVLTNDWISKQPVVMPVGIAELGIDGLDVERPDGPFDERCRTGLLSVDGDDVPVRLSGDRGDAAAGAPLDLSPCRGGVELGRGEHVVRTARGADTGLAVDRLVWRSAAGGDPASLEPPPVDGSRGVARRPAQPSSASVQVVDQGRVDATVDVGPRAGPTWLVLGQSHSSGWRAELDGEDLGEPTLVNGYANGWLLPAGSGTARVELVWTPQRVVNAGLVASAVAVVGCLVIALVPWRRRRSRRAPPGSRRTPAVGDEQPAPLSLRSALTSVGDRPPLVVLAVTALGAALVATAAAGPVAGIAVGVVTAAAMRWRRARPLVLLAPAALLALSALYTIFLQLRDDLPSGFEWPSYFERVHPLAYAGVILLAVELVVDRCWTGRWWPTAERESAPQTTVAEGGSQGGGWGRWT